MLLAMFAFAWSPADAQQAAPETPTEVSPLDADQPSAEELERRTRELDALQEAMERAAESRRQLESEISVLQQDRASLNRALIDTTTRIRETEARSDELERRLETLLASEAAIRRSLEARRGIIIEVLAALQRMGRRPPPAVLVRPEDILEAVRTSMLLGAVVPELRAETEALAADLSELVRLRTAISADQSTLSGELASLDQERRRLAGLIEARQMRLRTVERDFAGEAARVSDLAGRAATLKELIEGMEEEITAAREAAEAARGGQRDAAAGEPPTLCGRGFSRSGTAFAPDPVRTGARHASSTRQRGGDARIRRTGRIWRNQPGNFNFDTSGRNRDVSCGWLGGIFRTLPVLWTAIDHQCRRRVLCSSGRDGYYKRRCGSVRSRRGAGRDNGSVFDLVAGCRPRRVRRSGSVCRVS